MSIRKAVFPVAGLGTRFLPATKTVPKELLPVLDKPLIQYASEEALRAGVTELIFVVSRGKMAIRDYYDRAHELEALLADRNKGPLLDSVRSMKPEGVHCSFVLQSEPRGLGHAVLCAREAVGNEPFAVILPDDLIDDGERGCLVQMADDFARRGRSLVAVEIVPPSDTDKYGVVTIDSADGSVARMTGIVEKPKPAEAPSNLGVVGRYLFTAGIFDHLERVGAGSGGEIQLTDAVARMLPEEDVFAFRFEGTRYDCGSKAGMLRATLAYALKDPTLAPLIRGQSRNP